MKPTIVLVGRPNVGKSTLFNRLTRSKDALVADLPGLTRDRHYGHGRVGDKPYLIVDTGGYYGMRKYSKAYKKIAREKGAVFVPGILDGIFTKNQYKSDKIHPNAAGYTIVAERVEKAIAPYL